MDKEINIFANDLDEQTKKQFDHCCSQDYVLKAALMPDAHSGYVAPIGSVFVVQNHVVPSWVGYDIGCGMIALKIIGKDLVKKVQEKKKEIYDEVNKRVPMGTGKVNHIKDVSVKTKIEFKKILQQFQGWDHKEEIYRYLKNKSLSHLGSLGSGNHFIELGLDEEQENLWLIIHSGSRGVGHKVATHYMKEASGKEKEFEATHPLSLASQEGQEYLNVLNFGLDFAILNRYEIAYKVRDAIAHIIEEDNLELELWVNKNHNHAVFVDGNYVHRKGATPADKGERGVIPANMKEGCFLVEGLGNEKFLKSSSHGAGRKLSRTEAKKLIKQNEFEKEMEGIVGTVTEKTIDEAPGAYKDIYNVMEQQKESVKIISHIKPIINWKGE